MNRFHVGTLLVGLHTLRVNPLRTLLSTLGVIIGVAALVAVLSLGDSLEAFSRRQIEETTDLQSVLIASKTTDRVDGILVPRRDVHTLTASDARDFAGRIEGLGSATLTLTRSDWVSLDVSGLLSSDTLAVEHPAMIVATLPGALDLDDAKLEAGRFLQTSDFDAPEPVAVLSDRAARFFAPAGKSADLIGMQLRTGERIVGVLSPPERATPPTVILPIDSRNLARLQDRDHVPTLHVRAARIENVEAIVSAAGTWLQNRFPDQADDFSIASSSGRVGQAAQAMMVFKLALGSIAAISLIVGGIGIMNILLASVTERTREIGLRRASGARRGHILMQFLSESIIITVAGSVVGALLGVGATYLVTFTIGALTEAPLSAVFSIGSLLFAAAAAVLIGLAFGTYPARRAADIEPAVAMRHE